MRRHNGSVVSSRIPELRSPFARAVVPVVGGIAFFVVLGLVTWAIAAFLSSGDNEPTEDLAPVRLELGSVARQANNVDEGGPILIPELLTITGDRSLVLDHEGDDPAEGWRLYYAFPAGRPDCPVDQIRTTATFVDCDGVEIDVTELSPPTEAVRPVVQDGETLYLDLRAFSAPTGATGAGTAGSSPAATTDP
ncbi:hypothetical protein [Ilumatobacter sp.]|uniref:hypothetical protein n=1 Tax=Ilumatobacter sp. TaxID=1967498 RepID=UPI003B51F2AA